MFDSHVAILLDTAAALVNVLTDGGDRGRPYTAPRADALPEAIGAVLPGEPAVSMEEALYLAGTTLKVRRVFEAMDGGRDDDAAGIVNALVISTGARPQLNRVPGEPWQMHFHGADDTLSVGWSAGFASALTLAIGSDLGGRLGVCQAKGCDRVYVDVSRNAVRQFCSRSCQSRTKAAAFRARSAARPPA
ncbi:CGNR zinc finger domain-containing protein [Nonomuraea fuscirosea]|uniref:CGNR zinc finger domain-containing protein n=1 Tax=Nonomuraea fuscirosea TaxID=1291556 RepID=UPI002DDC1C4B|nr:CGNR zinc finger domain-containing protein [Nonomuraea fuscirosea]WSA58567.1 CGNR zinc finger domain-containing protein [Nonomuraea fuscirosea]